MRLKKGMTTTWLSQTKKAKGKVKARMTETRSLTKVRTMKWTKIQRSLSKQNLKSTRTELWPMRMLKWRARSSKILISKNSPKIAMVTKIQTLESTMTMTTTQMAMMLRARMEKIVMRMTTRIAKETRRLRAKKQRLSTRL